MKFAKYLLEDRISGKVKRDLIGAIKNPKKDTIIVGDNKVIVKPQDSGVSFTFDEDMFELSMTLTDLVDTMGYKQKMRKKNKIIVFTVIPKAW